MRAPVAGLTALVVTAVVAGCEPASRPAPTGPSLGAGPTPAELASVTAAPTATEEPNRHGLDVRALEPAWTSSILEFASDGESVIYSSGSADDPADAGSAPDLWRYVPGRAEPELLWRNPDRASSIVRIAGDLGTWAFVAMRSGDVPHWELLAMDGSGSEPTVLATIAVDPNVPTLVPSFTVHAGQVVWAEFAAGNAWPVSRLVHAAAPTWTPRVLGERRAEDAEYWLPSLRGSILAFTLVTYAPDRSSDERSVYVMDIDAPDAAPRRLDDSGLATMPLVVEGGVIWKESEPGFSMFNWGTLVRYDDARETVEAVDLGPQSYVNYPSAGSRFVAAWGSDSFVFTVHDVELAEERTIARYPSSSNKNVLRPHVAGDLLVWIHTEADGLGNGPPPEVRYAFLPVAGGDR